MLVKGSQVKNPTLNSFPCVMHWSVPLSASLNVNSLTTPGDITSGAYTDKGATWILQAELGKIVQLTVRCRHCRTTTTLSKLEVWICRTIHDDVIKWKYFPRYWPFARGIHRSHFPRNWPFVRGIHRSPVNSPHKGQWRWALMFPLIYAWMHGCANNREAGDLRRHRAHYDVTAMYQPQS